MENKNSGKYSDSEVVLDCVSVISTTDEQKKNVPLYDENLLEQSRTQWQFGDWESLAKIDQETLQHHPDRAKLALLAAAGHAQMGDMKKMRRFVHLSQDWGGSKRLISQVLIAGVNNTIGRAYMCKGEEKIALYYFEAAIKIFQSNNESILFSESRAVREAARIGLLPQAVRLIESRIKDIKAHKKQEQARMKIIETEIELLRHELSLAQQRKQLFTSNTKLNKTINTDSKEWKSQLKMKSVSQLGQDLWVLEKTNYKRGGFFVEFGATDGVLLSNSWLLEKEFGWQGICAEPNPKFFKELKQNRNCIVSNQYIGRETGKDVEFILADAYGGSSEFADADDHKEKRKAYADAGNIITFTSISLDDFLMKHHAPRNIDYMSIDTEGSEYELLSSFPFHKWNIRLLTIEHNYSPKREKILNLLNKNGYVRTEHDWDDWYEKVE